MPDYNRFFGANDRGLVQPSESRGKNEIPWFFIWLYFILAAVLCYLYHLKIAVNADWSALNSIGAVASFETAKPYQFRLLIPLMFKLVSSPYAMKFIYFYYFYNLVIVFSTIIIFYKMMAGKFFCNERLMLWFAPLILYPMVWNYIILNQSFQYYDFTSILIYTIGLYFISKENYAGLVIIFIIGLINKETIGYLIFSYIFYNYKDIFKSKIILRAAVLGILFAVWKLFLNYIFRDNPGDSVEIGYYENIRIVKELFSNRILLKNLALNFGGMYVAVILLFITGAWKKFPNRKLLFMNLAIIPYYIFGIYITYITEVRVYTELIPMITTLFLIYLSSFERIGLRSYPVKEKETKIA